MNKTNLFENLKRNKKILTKRPAVTDVYLQLKFDETGAYVVVVDENQNEIETEYEFYTGSTREILKTISLIQERNVFRIDWTAPNGRVYLHEHEYLLWQLKNNDKFVDSNFKLLKFIENISNVTIEIIPNEKYFSSFIFIQHKGKKINDLKLLTESHVFSDGCIYSINPLSDNFRDIHLFETQILETQLEKFLSLLYSYFDNVQLQYENFSTVEGQVKQTLPTLIFEQIDNDHSLYLRISTSVTGYDSDFLDDYDISKIASLHDLEKKIVVSEIIREDVHACFAEIEKLLKKCKRSLKNGADYYLDDNLIIIEEELAKEFLYKELTFLVTKFSIFGAEKLKSYKVRAVTPKLNVSLSHGIDFLEGDASLDIDGQVISLFDALTQFKKSNYIQLSDGTHAIINKNYIAKLQRLFKKQDKKVKISFFDLPIVEDLIEEKLAQESFKQSREIFLGFNKLEKAKINYPKLHGDLRSYQKQGYKWINYLYKHGLGGCLADDMGLGKTIQAIAILSSAYPDTKQSSLVIMPKTLLFNWANEIEKFNPNLSFYVYHGLDRNINEAKKKNLIFTTYATVRNDIQKLQEIEFFYIILDESQNIKNLASQSSKAVMLLSSNHRLALSGTPIENNLSELYALFRFLNPSMFGSIDEFNRNYAYPIQRSDDKDALNELKKKIYPFILRRLKKDVAKDLPDKIEQTLYVDMSHEQQAFYEKRRMFYYQTVKMQIAESGIKKSQFFILQALSELRQIASIPESKSDNQILSPKREVLIENILDVIANNHKVLVFANFLNALENIGSDLKKNNIQYLTMTGATQDRQTLVEQFQNENTHKVFLMTLKTGGLGLNLTAADYIFIYDPWWNIATENQAIDRTHRIGQDKTVFSYKIITRKDKSSGN
jgi:SNF2 family DNA or RNA helicase